MKNKKNIKKCIIIILAIVIIVIGWKLLKKTLNDIDNDNLMTSNDRMEKVLNETKPTAFFVRGDKVCFSISVNVTDIAEINEASIKNGKEYTVIVINDLFGNVSLSDSEIEYSKNLIEQGKCILFYFGEKYADIWDPQPDEGVEAENNLCYVYYYEDNRMFAYIGGWSKENMELLSEYDDALGNTILTILETIME